MSDQLTIPEPHVQAPATKGRSAFEITTDLRLRLRARYGAGDGRRYVVLEEVANATGSGASRSCDLLAISLWPSDGLDWHGHEIKASRSDWLREIKDPDKADAFAGYCDRWWIVAADRGVVQTGELRDGWGLLVPGGDGLRVVVGAAKREPKPVTRKFLAALMRRFIEAQQRALALAPEGEERRNLERKLAAAERERQTAELSRKRVDEELQNLRASVSAFQQASGIQIDRYGGGQQLGEDVARLRSLSLNTWQLKRFERLAADARDLAEVATRAAEAAKAFAATPEQEESRV